MPAQRIIDRQIFNFLAVKMRIHIDQVRNPALSISISKWSSDRYTQCCTGGCVVHSGRLLRTKFAIYVSSKYPISYLIAYPPTRVIHGVTGETMRRVHELHRSRVDYNAKRSATLGSM